MRQPRTRKGSSNEVMPWSADSSARDRLLEGVPADERRLDVNGSMTYVLAAGQGTPMVLLHGGIQSGGVYWGCLISRLADTHRLLVPDVPGLGESEPLVRLDAATFADWFEELLRQTGHEQSTVLAHSTVGSLVARFAARPGHDLRRLVLSATPGIGRYRMPPGLLVAAIRSGLRPSERNFERFLPWPFLDPGRIRQSNPEWFAAFSAYMISRSGLPSVRRTMQQVVKAGTRQIPATELRRITVPTALIWGRHDRMAPLHLAESASSAFGWPLHVIEDSGHVPFLEQPDAFLGALAEATREHGSDLT
jgi:pimeloyl-ACP methyl ester carboxylesterase